MICPVSWFQVPLLLRDAIAILGFGVGVVLWPRLDRAQRLIACWLLWAGVVDLLSLYLGCHDDASRRQVIQFWFPVSALLALGALGALQGAVSRRDLFRLTALGYILAWAVMMVTVETTGQYPKFTSEVHTLLLLGAAALTLVRRASIARQHLHRDPGFLVGCAMLVYSVPTLFMSLASRELMPDHPTALHAYLSAQGGISALTFSVIIVAMVLQSRRSQRGPAA